MRANNPFDLYTSKIKRFNIPLAEFKYFHKASSAEEVDPKFLGREEITNRLFSWLIKEKTKSGSYIVMGFRGMGKSSFVGRVVYEITAKPSFWTYLIGWLCFGTLWAVLFYIINGINYDGTDCQQFSECIKKIPTHSETYAEKLYIYYFFVPIAIILCTFFRFHFLNLYRKTSFIAKIVFEVLFRNGDGRYCQNGIFNKLAFIWKLRIDLRKNWHKIRRELHGTDVSRKSYHRIDISVNLGQEILNERDVLCVLTNELYNKYKSFVLSPIANCLHWFLATIFVFSVAFLLCLFLPDSVQFRCFFTTHTIPLPPIVYLGLSYLIYIVFTTQILYSQHRSLRKLRTLKETLDSIIKLEASAGANIEPIGYLETIGLKFRKSWTRSKANIRNIEEELIAILHRINQGLCSPSFIFILDELDKIETGNIQFEDKSGAAPEFTSEKNFPGSGTSRKRKQNVLHLLANMKLFISTAKSKFIFIAGRELYDAYLADLSDREFSVSSVFYGVINVESFCTNVRKEKDVMSNAETFICKQLIPKEYVRRESIKAFLNNRKNGKNFSYIDINLKMYYRYMIDEYVNEYEKHYDRAKMESDQGYREYRLCLDKAVVLLYHFAVYLYHISNGSPKKMSLYFEKYIRSTPSRRMFSLPVHVKGDNRILEDKSVDLWCNKKIKNYLSFGYIDQRRIGFIHYIAFPVTQIIINANKFGDKLLVSASFLVDHIYKFHNGGFSALNLEHTPELLEVYKIPEFRDFIDSILSYLTQTHIIPITCGLFQYKFRKQIAEEISLASKFSEEIAALFNFTLDESLSVKQHYYELQRYYKKQLDEEKSTSPHLLIGQHQIMADLYMADEEYTQAAFEYQTAIEIIKKQKDFKKIFKVDTNNPLSSSISYMLLLIRNMLKLGMAYEKRKSFDSAYVTYSELIGSLIDFRYIDEQSLGLDYVVNKTDKWPSYKAVLYAGEKTDIQKFDKTVRPHIIPKENLEQRSSKYSTDGSTIITDFAHHITKEKSAIIQRLTMLEDIRMMYQALLAKLFVLEKMELGGITHTNIAIIESEYSFLHLATNEKDKFLISTDFFRRLGDIMFYKNGLTGNRIDSFCEGLFYWTYNVNTEILDYCNEHECYQIKDALTEVAYDIKDENIIEPSDSERLKDVIMKAFVDANNKRGGAIERDILESFCYGISQRLERLPINAIKECNVHRQEMWKKGCPVPCYACKYYNRSLRLIMENLFDMKDVEGKCNDERVSKSILILRYLIKKGSSVSLRQNNIIQFAEVLECMGNLMLSCASGEDCIIHEGFLKDFLHDVHIMNMREHVELSEDKFHLLSYSNNEKIYKLEKGLIYYWEAAVCFKIANEHKKAAGSFKKILRTFQNYLLLDVPHDISKQRLIGDYLEEIKERIIKQCLISLYAHYDFINIIEIQKLKWVFTIQMYESISLNRLSHFPDVEEIMLIYYDILRNCILKDIPTAQPYRPRSWKTYEERNRDFQYRLAGIYKNITLSSLRIESTFYERVLSLRFKANMNQHILHHIFAFYDSDLENKYFELGINRRFVDFLSNYICDNTHDLKDVLQEYSDCFSTIWKDNNSTNDPSWMLKFHFLEFIIKDSIYCLTRILEIITPYTDTTLFTNTFLGEIYTNLYKWIKLFDGLFISYKVAEISTRNLDRNDTIGEESCCDFDNRFSEELCPYRNTVNKDSGNIVKNKCPYYENKCSHKRTSFDYIQDFIKQDKELHEILSSYTKDNNRIAQNFFTVVLDSIGKTNIHYTLGNYAIEMALKSYQSVLETHHEGCAYKSMISGMSYLDDDLKNDTIQFDSAIERMKINNNFIHGRMKEILDSFKINSIYDIESFCMDNETALPIEGRFDE